MSDPNHIFVYGTLRADSDHPMARRLAAQARHVGKGHAPGRLYDCGWYPAAIFNESEKRLVVGDVYALKPGGKLLAELDAYEAGGPDYGRKPLAVRLTDGRTILAWAYSVTTAPSSKVIHSGDFIAHKAGKASRPTRS